MTRVRSSLAILAAVAMGITIMPATGTAQSKGVAYVAVQAVLQKTPGYTEAEATWATEVEGYKRQMTELQARLDSANTAFEQKSAMLSPSNRAAERKQLEEQAGVMQQQVADLNQKAGERQRELLDPIEQRVVAVIESLRVEGNYAIVFDVSAPGSNVVTADKSLDLTRKAIDRLTASAGSSGND
ncbi:MAG TPA: OmpH family outer membrane protein [Gemmatimonadales bacterium]|nr:OmpH family outer membrane protein [Gemmatimonadales bacterium]